MNQNQNEIDILKTLVIVGGIILSSLRGKVENIPKVSDLPIDKIHESSTAHTVADDVVQEVILEVLYSYLPEVRISVEEKTSRVNWFDMNKSEMCFHLDPLDGTLSYLQNRDDYAIGAAFTHNFEFTSSAIYFPVTDHLYYAEKGKGVHIQTSFGKEISFKRPSNALNKYLQKRCEEFIPIMEKMQLEQYDLRSAHHGMIAVAEGRVSVQMYHMASPHDFGIPKLIVEEAGGICTDIHGNPITFGPEFIRIPYFFAFFDRTVYNTFFALLNAQRKNIS